MAAKRKAKAIWKGDLMSGTGTVDLGTSHAAEKLDVTWQSRTEDDPGAKTSPEELIAAALASCFSMALSHGLTKGGNKPDRLDVEATSSFEKGDDGFHIASMNLVVRGKVPGIDAAAFKEAAEAAAKGCPVSKALKNNVKISVDAALA
jgi:osmotically inducible protein OsmC